MPGAVWTLWLVTFGSVIGNGGASATVTPLATYAGHDDCIVALEAISIDMRKEYGAKNTPSPGLMFCVYGGPVKR